MAPPPHWARLTCGSHTPGGGSGGAGAPPDQPDQPLAPEHGLAAALLDLAGQPLDPVDGGPVRPHHLLLVPGGHQGLVDTVGAEQLAEGRGRPRRVGRPQPPAELPAGGAQARRAPRPDGRPAPAGGSWPGLADPIVVLDQALDPGAHAVDGRLDPGRLGPQADDLPGPARGGVGDLGVDTAEEHERDEEMPKLAQGEVPFAWRVCGRAGTLSRRTRAGKCPHPIPLPPSGVARNCPEYFVTTG
jgi:hypothetical protein